MKDPWSIAEPILAKITDYKDFRDDHKAQATSIHTLSGLFRLMSAEHKQAVVAALSPRVPRLDHYDSGRSQILEKILQLDTYEDISRALKVEPQTGSFIMEPEEAIYPDAGFIGDFIHWARQCRCPFGFLFWSAVSAIGTAARYNYYFDWGVKNIRLNEYVILVGDKSTGKSLAKDAALEVLRRANRHLGEGNTLRLLPEDTTMENILTRMKYRISHATEDEGVLAMTEEDSTALLALDEIATFLGKQTFNSEKRIPFLTTIYGRDEYEGETKTGGKETLKNVAFGLIACTAPEWLKDSVTPSLFNKGFMDRTMFIHRNRVNCRAYPIPLPQDPLVAESLARWLAEIASETGRVEMMATPEGMAWYTDWYNKKNSKPEVQWGHHTTSVDRQSIHLWKLACILSLSYEEMPWVSEERLIEAAKYTSNEGEHFRQCMDVVGQAPQVELEEYLLSAVRRIGGGGWVSQSQLLAAIRGKLALRSTGNKRAKALLDDLVGSDFLNCKQEGRTTLYRVEDNPNGKG